MTDLGEPPSPLKTRRFAAVLLGIVLGACLASKLSWSLPGQPDAELVERLALDLFGSVSGLQTGTQSISGLGALGNTEAYADRNDRRQLDRPEARSVELRARELGWRDVRLSFDGDDLVVRAVVDDVVVAYDGARLSVFPERPDAVLPATSAGALLGGLLAAAFHRWRTRLPERPVMARLRRAVAAGALPLLAALVILLPLALGGVEDPQEPYLVVAVGVAVLLSPVWLLLFVAIAPVVMLVSSRRASSSGARVGASFP